MDYEDIRKAWFQDISKLVSRTKKLYTRLQEEKGKQDIWTISTDKIIEERKWNLDSLEKRYLRELVEELSVFYVPKTLGPGPCYTFPLKDVDGVYHRAQTKPLHKRFSDSKYFFLGDKLEGPQWFGLSDYIWKRMYDCNALVLVEGPFDLLAARIVAPDVPIVTSLTKGIGKKHVAFLEMLPISKLYVMMDNERSKVGLTAMEMITKMVTSQEVIQLTCPAKDPSNALESVLSKKKLKKILQDIKSGVSITNVASTLELEEESW